MTTNKDNFTVEDVTVTLANTTRAGLEEIIKADLSPGSNTIANYSFNETPAAVLSESFVSLTYQDFLQDSLSAGLISSEAFDFHSSIPAVLFGQPNRMAFNITVSPLENLTNASLEDVLPTNASNVTVAQSFFYNSTEDSIQLPALNPGENITISIEATVPVPEDPLKETADLSKDTRLIFERKTVAEQFLAAPIEEIEETIQIEENLTGILNFETTASIAFAGSLIDKISVLDTEGIRTELPTARFVTENSCRDFAELAGTLKRRGKAYRELFEQLNITLDKEAIKDTINSIVTGGLDPELGGLLLEQGVTEEEIEAFVEFVTDNREALETTIEERVEIGQSIHLLSRDLCANASVKLFRNMLVYFDDRGETVNLTEDERRQLNETNNAFKSAFVRGNLQEIKETSRGLADLSFGLGIKSGDRTFIKTYEVAFRSELSAIMGVAGDEERALTELEALGDPLETFCKDNEIWERRISITGETIEERKIKECLFACGETHNGATCLTYPFEDGAFILLNETVLIDGKDVGIVVKYRPDETIIEKFFGSLQNLIQGFIDAVISPDPVIKGDAFSFLGSIRLDFACRATSSNPIIVDLTAHDLTVGGSLTLIRRNIPPNPPIPPVVFNPLFGVTFVPAGPVGVQYTGIPTDNPFWKPSNNYRVDFNLECREQRDVFSDSGSVRVVLPPTPPPATTPCTGSTSLSFGPPVVEEQLFVKATTSGLSSGCDLFTSSVKDFRGCQSGDTICNCKLAGGG